MSEMIQRESALSSASDVRNEKKSKKSGRTTADEKGTSGANFWERVADDVASGYESKEDENDVLNIDQSPEDNQQAGNDRENEK